MTAQRPLTVSSAPTGLTGRVRVPGDKSISHRALMFAALAEGRTHISGLLEGEDVLRTAEAMRALGAKVVQKDGRWIVDGCGVNGLQEPADVLDMGNSGTAARLLSGVLATHPFMSIMTGDASLRGRPMGRVSVPLSETGARFVTRAGHKLPMAVEGTGKGKPLHYRLPVASAQVKSAILLAGLNCDGTGGPIISGFPSRGSSARAGFGDCCRGRGTESTADGSFQDIEGNGGFSRAA